MSRPVLMAVDDDGPVLAAVERDLRDRYAEHYQVITASSGDQALDLLRRLRLREDTVALLLVDQRMPGMSGTEFLAASRELYPDAKRVLLTAYADTDAAIRAINDADVHHYLLKPWDPPDERLYPVLDDLLETWRRPAPTANLRVVGDRWSAEQPRAPRVPGPQPGALPAGWTSRPIRRPGSCWTRPAPTPASCRSW